MLINIWEMESGVLDRQIHSNLNSLCDFYNLSFWHLLDQVLLAAADPVLSDSSVDLTTVNKLLIMVSQSG